jgi:hypothetical protein|tara:strand:+ start:212 stop:976 length:765 start_codon:yes stop_codon:yes gene_type:complete
MDSISILLVAERGTGDRIVRLAWQKTTGPYHSAESVTPSYIARQMQEWKFYPSMNSVRRMRMQPGICGDATGIELRIYLARKWQFYIYKIAFVIYMITALSWFSFGFNIDDGIVDTTRVMERLSYASSLLLASVAFLYISTDSIPKLPYLTTLDQMILYGFVNLGLVMTESFVVFRMSRSNWDVEIVKSIDLHASWFVPLLYVANQLYVIWIAFESRKKCRIAAINEMVGVEPALIATTIEEMSRRRWWHQDFH